MLHQYQLTDGRSRAELTAAMRRMMLDDRLRRAERKGGDRHVMYVLEAAA